MLNRREAIAAGVGLIAGAVSPLSDVTPSGQRDWAELAKHETAEFVSEWEISALRSNCPHDWQRFAYTTGVQWIKRAVDPMFVIFGVGPPEHCEKEFEFHLEQWKDEGLVDAHITPDRCAWALTLRGTLSDALRAELRSSAPSFGCVPFDEFERTSDNPFGCAQSESERYKF